MKVAVLLMALIAAAPASAQDRFALVISGASGSDLHAARHDTWRVELAAALTGAWQFPAANVSILSDAPDAASRATADNVQRLFADLRRRTGSHDIVLVVLIGHGTFDGADAKFNLVGPDLTASEWKQLLAALPARAVVVNTTSASFPFLEELSQRGRVVITATDSAAQRFGTVFPEYFVKAIADPATDLDKNGRVSVWETFLAAGAAVKRHYEQRGQLSTERPLLDDDGDRVGREADAPGEDGALARTIYLGAAPAAAAATPAMSALERQRTEIEAQVEALKSRKASTPEDQYHEELERLLVQLARITQQIRQRS